MGTADVDVSVVSSGHDVADARLHRLIAAFMRAGLSVELIGLGDPSKAPTGVRVRTRAARSLAGRATDALTAPWRASGQVVFVVDPDAVPSAALRHLTGKRLVVDVHEDYGLLAADREWSSGRMAPLVHTATRAVTTLTRRADLVVVADDNLPPLDARERMVVPNLPDFSQLPEPVARDAEPRALYVGDVRRSRGLFAMLDLVAATDAWTLDIVGPVAAADADELQRRLAEAALDSRVRLHGRKPPTEAWELARGAWLGFSMLEPTPAFIRAIPSKVYEYLACGLPVVASALPRQSELLTETGGGLTVNGTSDGAKLMQSWAEDASGLDSMRDAAAAWAQRVRAEPSGYDLLAARIREWVR